MTTFRGKLHRPPKVGVPAPLTRDDLQLLREPNRNPAPQVQRLRNSHHNVAMMLAAGMKQRDISARTGYSPARIALLSTSPAMQELIAKYRERLDDSFVDQAANFFSMMFNNMVAAERQLADKLEEADERDETLPTRELVAITSDRADRTGFGKMQTNVNVNADFASMLEKAIRRSGKVVEANPPPSRMAPQLPQEAEIVTDVPPPSKLRRIG